MRIPETLLGQWLEKLRDEKLQFRESWRVEDVPSLRCRNSLTDLFHYNPYGLLLRTKVGKSLGSFTEIDFPEVESYFVMKGVKYTPYDEYEPQPRKLLPLTHTLGPKLLYNKFGFSFLSAKESCDFHLRMLQRISFVTLADQIENRKPEIPTHSNPMLAF